MAQAKPLEAYRARHGLSYQEVADRLNAVLQPAREKKGRQPITVEGVERYSLYTKLPKPWIEALGLDEMGVESGDWHQPQQRAEPPSEVTEPSFDDPPMMPPDGKREQARLEPEPTGSSEFAVVNDRLEKAYNAIGSGFSMATRNDGYAAVTQTYSPHLAQAWVNAARENEHAKRIVEFMESGGAVGELVVAHVILLMGFVYVSGRAPALRPIVGDRFDRYHAAAAANAAAEAAAEHGAPGQDEFAGGVNGSQGGMGDVGGFPGA